MAFRSLSRLSSALSAKASTLCSLSLDLDALVHASLTFDVASSTRKHFIKALLFFFTEKLLDEIDFSSL